MKAKGNKTIKKSKQNKTRKYWKNIWKKINNRITPKRPSCKKNVSLI